MKIAPGQLWISKSENGNITLMTQPWGSRNLHTRAPIFIIRHLELDGSIRSLTWELMTEHGIMYSYDVHLRKYLLLYNAALAD